MGIFDKLFGEKLGPKSVKLPWEPDGVIEANLAIGNMRESLLGWMKIDGRIHTETLMMVTGALAGMASQNAVRNTYGKSGIAIPENGFVAVKTQSGETFNFGDLLNGYLETLQVPEDHQPQLMPRKAIELFWLPTVSILTRKEPTGQALASAHWPVVLAIVAQQFIHMTKDVLDPRVGVRLVMESAIISSKFDTQSLSLSQPK